MSEETAQLIIQGAMLGIFLFVASVLLLRFLRSFLYICEPNQVIVFTGRATRVDGRRRGYAVLRAGRRIRVPFIEQAQILDMSIMPVDVKITNAYSKGNIPLNVHAIANVKIAALEPALDNGIERFLGRERAEIQRVARETIEGSLRGVLAKLTPEQVNEDRLKFVQVLAADAEDDLAKIGLQLDTLKIQSVTDEVNYLNSIGRARIAEALRDAEMAESNARREADRAIAESEAQGRVARETANAAIDSRRNDLRRMVAEFEAQARNAEETTTAAESEARARAEVRLQELRTDLERLRLQADQVLPAEAEKLVAELEAQSKAAPIAAEGRASAESLRLISEAWTEAGPAATDIFVLQQLEPLIKQIVAQIGRVDLGRVNLVDAGDGAALGRLAASQPAIVAQVLDAVGRTAGIDIGEILRRQSALVPKSSRPPSTPSTPPRPTNFVTPTQAAASTTAFAPAQATATGPFAPTAQAAPGAASPGLPPSTPLDDATRRMAQTQPANPLDSASLARARAHAAGAPLTPAPGAAAEPAQPAEVPVARPNLNDPNRGGNHG